MADQDQIRAGKNQGTRLPLAAIIVGLVPLVGLISGLWFLSRAEVGLSNQEQYLRHARFWGGNPAEVYSHWLDMLLMSGNAAALAVLLSAEAYWRRDREPPSSLQQYTWMCAALGIVISGAVAIALD